MTERYTAADFANAQFAEHPNGAFAKRDGEDKVLTWLIADCGGAAGRQDDESMSLCGWVPVVPARTIHDSDVEALCTDTASYERDDYLDGFMRGFQQAGGVILDDPEPTNEELLTGLVKELDEAIGLNVAPILVARYLNDHGVTAPNVKGN